MESSSSSKKYLLIFDMDQTLIDEPSFYLAAELLPKEEYHKALSTYFEQWHGKAKNIASILGKNKIKQEDIKKQIQNIPLVPGIEKVFEFIDNIKSNNKDYLDFIIVSGSINHFIEWTVDKYNMTKHLSEIISFKSTNSKHDKETLEVNPYHSHNCQRCDDYLCKGKAINDFVVKKNKEGIIYDKIAFFGDGDNDLCAGLALNTVTAKENKYFCVRKWHVLYNVIFDKNEELIKDFKNRFESEILIWEDGNDMFELINNKIFKY